jgi:ATP-binding cassette, subfamily C (CFTR/MRP), member 1
MSAIASAVLVFISSSYVAAAIPVCIVVLVLIALFYLRTSRQMRLLDIETKAPLFQHFLETINGIACIRAYGWTENFTQRNVQALNNSQKPYYLLFCIQRWLTLVLDLFNAGVAILLVAVALHVPGGSTGFLGVALYNVASFGPTLQTLITQWTQVETALGSINRIRSYVSDVKDENLPSEVERPPEHWPTHGSIKFENVTASYDASLDPVLRDVSFSIQAGEKIAICGRSGRYVSFELRRLYRPYADEPPVVNLLFCRRSFAC